MAQLSNTSINTAEESQAPSRMLPSPFTDNEFKRSPKAAGVSGRMFPVTPRRVEAPTVSGAHSCQLLSATATPGEI